MNPRVTVLMPVFNRERFVDEAIESVIAQDFADFELVIVDDGSTDRTPELLRAWAQRDARIVVVTSPENQGIPAALNAGLRHARASYVARLDSDDVMMPRRLAAQAEVLDREPEVVLVSCAYETMDREGKYLGTWRGDEPHEVVALIGMKQRDHGARSIVRYASVKRANWTGIMSDSLGRYLGRPIRDEEIAALITVWRHDGTTGMAPIADKTMREAFARFCGEHSDRELRRCARQRVARQWMEGARVFANAGHPAEATRFVARAARWSPATVVHSFLLDAGSVCGKNSRP